LATLLTHPSYLQVRFTENPQTRAVAVVIAQILLQSRRPHPNAGFAFEREDRLQAIIAANDRDMTPCRAREGLNSRGKR